MIDHQKVKQSILNQIDGETWQPHITTNRPKSRLTQRCSTANPTRTAIPASRMDTQTSLLIPITTAAGTRTGNSNSSLPSRGTGSNSSTKLLQPDNPVTTGSEFDSSYQTEPSTDELVSSQHPPVS